MTSEDSLTVPCELAEGVVLRRPTDEDVQGLAETLAMIDPWARYGFDPARLAGFFSQQEPAAPRFAIVKDGVAVGAVVLRMAWLHGPYLQFLGVCPAHQGQRLGSAVVDWLVRTARAEGSRNVFVCASDFNSAARRFYAAHGFVEIALLPSLIKDGFTEVLMRRAL